MIKPLSKNGLNRSNGMLRRRESKGFFVPSKGLENKIGWIEPSWPATNSDLYPSKVRACQDRHNRRNSIMSPRTTRPLNAETAQREIQIVTSHNKICSLHLVYFAQAGSSFAASIHICLWLYKTNVFPVPAEKTIRIVKAGPPPKRIASLSIIRKPAL